MGPGPRPPTSPPSAPSATGSRPSWPPRRRNLPHPPRLCLRPPRTGRRPRSSPPRAGRAWRRPQAGGGRSGTSWPRRTAATRSWRWPSPAARRARRPWRRAEVIRDIRRGVCDYLAASQGRARMGPAGQEEASGAPVEVELKLALDAAAMEAALASPLLRERARGPLRTRELRNTYYDTPDRRLHARGAVLRVREVEGRHVQTLKGARRPGGAVAARNEWEVELPGPEPRPDALDDPDAHELAGLLLPEELTPVFETRVRRRSLVVTWPDGTGSPAEIEVAFDDGLVRADGRGEAPLSELELELLRGDAGALFGLAEALRDVVPFRIEPQDKAARGWLLATGEAPPVRKAEPLDLDAGCTVGEALGRILSAALRHWLDNEPAAIAGRQPEGVHQTRVALRRLRSALALFEDALTPDALERWDGELRWLLGTLGPARDLDVLAGDLLPPLLEACGEDAALLAFREAAEAARGRAQGGGRAAARSPGAGDPPLHPARWGGPCG